MARSYVNIKKGKERDGEVEYEAELSELALGKAIGELLADIGKTFELSGFRKGQVPENIVRRHVNEMHLLEDAAEVAVRDAIQEIIADEEFTLLGAPHVTITKLAPGNPVEFKLRLALAPEITLPDYKKIGLAIAKREDAMEISEEEANTAIEHIKKMAHVRSGKKEEENTPLPELTDELVKLLGPFANVDEFKKELRNQLMEEKKLQIQQAKRDETLAEIVKKSKIRVPRLALDEELFEFRERRDEQLKEANLTLEDYIKQSGKTAEEVEKEEAAHIEGQIKSRLVFKEMVKWENLSADESEIRANAVQLKYRYPNRDENTLRRMAEAVIIHEKMFDILEGNPAKEIKNDDKKEKSAEVAPE